MNLDFKDTAGWKLMELEERNNAFFKRQQELKREREAREKERKTDDEERTDT